MKFTLSKPLVTHQGPVTEIELKELTAASFMKHAEPFRLSFDADSKPVFSDWNSKACVGFISDMTGFDEIVLKALSARDFFELRHALVSVIFGGAGRENPIAA